MRRVGNSRRKVEKRLATGEKWAAFAPPE